jgi:hypothetical protein
MAPFAFLHAGPLASALMPRFRKAALEIANDYAKQLRRINVPRRLVREAPKPIGQRRRSWERSKRILQSTAAA